MTEAAVLKSTHRGPPAVGFSWRTESTTSLVRDREPLPRQKRAKPDEKSDEKSYQDQIRTLEEDRPQRKDNGRLSLSKRVRKSRIHISPCLLGRAVRAFSALNAGEPYV
ncbi:hypothetical protein FQN50_000541 [Emmonsiellopsis sp. PD_5]|nr:hypothetical protein FQN50_000541 [Emmonsiellopsis sp. PD_5]